MRTRFRAMRRGVVALGTLVFFALISVGSDANPGRAGGEAGPKDTRTPARGNTVDRGTPNTDLIRREVRIVPFGAYGSPSWVTLKGRVLEDKRFRPGVDVSVVGNVRATVNAFESDEVSGVLVQASLAGQTFSATTDDDGIFTIEAKGLTPPARPGEVKTLYSLGSLGFAAPAIERHTWVLPDDDGVAVISDFDDTVVNSYVARKGKLLLGALTKNAAQLEAVPGAAAAYRAARDAGARTFFYLSGSPINLADRINDFLRIHDFPAGPLLLKNIGRDPLFDQEGYKPQRIEALLERFPRMRFILIGDSGEKDPEIYRRVRSRHPDRIAGIVIRRAPGADYAPGRLKDTIVIDDYGRAPTRLAELVRAAAYRARKAPPR